MRSGCSSSRTYGSRPLEPHDITRMTARRQFIKTFAGVPLLLALEPAFAAPDPARVALIIGNAAYKQAPLENPTNDATAMRDLFTTAGFTTDSLLNAKRTDLLAAIDRFTAAVQKSETKQAMFYYAGHGAQLDWRNYLLPVDIAVGEARGHQEAVRRSRHPPRAAVRPRTRPSSSSSTPVATTPSRAPTGRSRKACRSSTPRSAVCWPMPPRPATSPPTAAARTAFTPKTWCANCPTAAPKSKMP